MLIKIKDVKYIIPTKHPYALAIAALAKDYALNKGSRSSGAVDEPPERNDVKQLWRELGPKHKGLLEQVATRPGGASQADLEAALVIEWKDLRGIHNGLARICDRLGVAKPVRTTGYNATNRLYLMDPDSAHTVRNLVRRDKRA